jgi:GH24 family phage-related lysozyme (muramidase)
MSDIYTIAIKIIKQFEGFKAYPYYCPAFKLTIGYGEVIRPQKTYADILGIDIIKKSLPVANKNNLDIRNQSLKIQWGDLLTEDMAEKMLLNFLKDEVWKPIRYKIPQGLTDNQCAAILSFVYNIGVDAFIKSTFFKKLHNSTGKSTARDAASEFNNWVFADGKKLNGLIKRRLLEKNLFLTGL